MTDDVDELREFAETIAVRAGDEALAGRRRLGVGQPVAHDTKSTTTDPVTEYDRAAERLIVDEIRRRYPDDAIVGEEGADDSGTSGREWHVDPIDGTVNFVYDLPSWCTSIAVVDATGSIAGAVYAPVTGELFSAGRGTGCDAERLAIACSAVTELNGPSSPRDSATRPTAGRDRPTAWRGSFRASATCGVSARLRSTSVSWRAGASTPTTRSTSTRGTSPRRC
jgi:fructose-1,6-bisphosphatase/inositol monophosphatase family enzyme